MRRCSETWATSQYFFQACRCLGLEVIRKTNYFCNFFFYVTFFQSTLDATKVIGKNSFFSMTYISARRIFWDQLELCSFCGLASGGIWRRQKRGTCRFLNPELFSLNFSTFYLPRTFVNALGRGFRGCPTILDRFWVAGWEKVTNNFFSLKFFFNFFFNPKHISDVLECADYIYNSFRPKLEEKWAVNFHV